MDEIKLTLIRAIETSPSEEALAEYLFQISKKLQGEGSPQKDTLRFTECMKLAIEMRKESLKIEMEGAAFQTLNDFFWLTNGLHVIAAPSGHGKTFWAMEWAKSAAKQGHEVLFLSLEMTHRDMGARMLADLSGLPLKDIVKGKLTENQRMILEQMSEREDLQYLSRISVDKFPSLDWVKIYPRLWNAVMSRKPSLIIVDYLQMLHHSSSNDPRLSQIYSDIARELKLFADQTESAVIILSQMNREALREVRKGKWHDGWVPLSHEFIKESGGITEAADSVQIVCIPEKFSSCPDDMKHRFQITVDKSRGIGETGTRLFAFDMKQMKFVS